MFNLYELFKKYNVEHMIPWEAYRLENKLLVKISPGSDPLYPFNVGDIFRFMSYSTYRGGIPLTIQNISDDVRDRFPLMPNKKELYSSKIVEKVPLIKVIDMKDKNFNWEMLNFTLNGVPLYAEFLVFMLKEVQEAKLASVNL